jgi:1-deoxy-D-xylulose-5-phosphate synthase
MRDGRTVAILAFGTLLKPALAAGENLDATVIDMRFVKPLDAALLTELAGSHKLFVTVEENSVMGGAGAGVGEFLAAHNLPLSLLNLGLPDRFLEHGRAPDMLKACGLDAAGIEASIRQRLAALS